MAYKTNSGLASGETSRWARRSSGRDRRGVQCSGGPGADNDGYDSEGPAIDDLDRGGDHVSNGDLVSRGDLDSESNLDSEGPAGRDNKGPQ